MSRDPVDSLPTEDLSPPSREARLRACLERALDLPVDQRAAFLASEVEEPELAQEVEALLEREEALGDFLKPVAAPLPRETVEPLLDPPTEPGIPRQRVGPFRLLSLLGQGGMGQVYLAEQDEPVRRRVALKLVRTLLGHEASVRFQHERQALGRLSHPNIARLYEAGATAEGRPFVAMELVDGPPLTVYCDEQCLPPRERLRLFVAVCRGVEHAHQKQILHRDLKPSNLLVAEVDGKAVPKVIDFGIAKGLDDPLSELTVATGDRILGTPQYMSPEALDRESDDGLDTRADVYSLGVVLYELLVGVPPFVTPGTQFTRLLREILETTPPTLSARFTGLEQDLQRRIARARGGQPERLRSEVTGDLDWIVARALAKDREDRYDSVGALREEVQRVLRHEPVIARPPSPGYRLRKWALRHRFEAVLLTLVTAGLLTATLLTSIALVDAREAERQSSYESRVSKQTLEFLVGLFDAVSPEVARGQAVGAVELLEVGEERVRRLDIEPLPRAQILFHLADVYSRLGLYAPAQELARESLGLREANLQADAPEVLAALDLLGNLHRRAGQLGDAERLLERLVATAEQADDPLVLADAFNSLGNLRWRQRRLKEARRLHERTLTVRRLHLGPDDERVGSSHNNLGVMLFDLGAHVEAEPHLRRAAEILEATHGRSHPRVADALGNLSLVLTRLGRREEAATTQEKVLAIRRQVLGDEHPDTATALYNLGVAFEALDRPGEAEPRLRRALEVRGEALGDEHVETAKATELLVRVLSRLDRPGEAEALARSFWERHRHRPVEDPVRLRSERCWARFLIGQERFSAAREELERQLAMQRASPALDPGERAHTLHLLGRASRLEGRLEAAERDLREALDLWGQWSHPYRERRRAGTLYELGETLRSLGRIDEAKLAHRQALDFRAGLYVEGDEELQASREAVAALAAPADTSL